MRGLKIIFLSSIFPALGIAQIQSFEFGYGLTNNLSVPPGKIIKIHSLIGSSFSGRGITYSSGYYRSVDEFLSKASRGIAIILPSGRQIDISPSVVSVGGGNDTQSLSVLSSMNSISPHNPVLVPGPVTVAKNGDDNMLLIYEILDNAGTSSSAQAPSQGSSVVIPTSVTGDVDVKMEQSADNVTWTECLPGTYNSSTVKRFFRLRAVEK